MHLFDCERFFYSDEVGIQIFSSQEIDLNFVYNKLFQQTDEGSCFASGRSNWRQYLPFSVTPEDKEKYGNNNKYQRKSHIKIF